MRRKHILTLTQAGLLLALLITAPSAWSHHAFSAQYDGTKDVTLRGTVTKMEWVNPHASFFVEVKSPAGNSEEWKVQVGAPNMLRQRGLNPDSLKIGTAVTIAGYRARDGSLLADGEVMTADGKTWFLGGGLFLPLPVDSDGKPLVIAVRNLPQPKLPPPIRVLSSNGVKAAVEQFQTVAERAFTRHLDIEFSTTRSLQQRIEAGETFDVALLTKDAMDVLVREGKVAASTPTPIARSGIDVGIRRGNPKPDIRTPDALKRTLLNAKSVAYTVDGASRPVIDKMLASLGIAGDLEKKTLLEPAGQAPLRVAEGKAELVITLTSEIVPVAGIELVGPLPAAFQNEILFEAGLGANAKNSDAGKELIRFLSAPTAAAFFKAKGMETVR